MPRASVRPWRDSLGDYVAMMNFPGYVQGKTGERRLGPVALAAKGLRGERQGQPHAAHAIVTNAD